MFAAIAFLSLVGCVYAAIIDSPGDGSPWQKTATIAANGRGDTDEEQFTVYIKKGGSNVDSATVTTGANIPFNWNAGNAFEPPSGGWAIGTDYTCELFKAGDQVDSNSFSVTGS